MDHELLPPWTSHTSPNLRLLNFRNSEVSTTPSHPPVAQLQGSASVSGTLRALKSKFRPCLHCIHSTLDLGWETLAYTSTELYNGTVYNKCIPTFYIVPCYSFTYSVPSSEDLAFMLMYPDFLAQDSEDSDYKHFSTKTKTKCES